MRRYELDPNETLERVVESDETFENALIDATAPDAEVRIDARGSDWTIRDVGVRGRLTDRDTPVFRLQADEETDGTFENVYLGDGSTDGGHSGVFVPTTHEGTLRMRGVNVGNWADNGIYASAPGRAERGGRGGRVVISRSYAHDNNIAGFRLGTDRSVVRDSVVRVEKSVPTNPQGKSNARGIWVKEGGSVRIDRCEVLVGGPDGSYCIWEGDDDSVGLARVIDSAVAAGDGAKGRFRGNVETENVGTDPDVSRPLGVPASARAAAMGRNATDETTTNSDDR